LVLVPPKYGVGSILVRVANAYEQLKLSLEGKKKIIYLANESNSSLSLSSNIKQTKLNNNNNV